MIYFCRHESRKKHGKNRNGNQRFRCLDCGKTFQDGRSKPLGDMRIDLSKAAMALRLLLEGMSIRAFERITNIHRDTVCSMILVVGDHCQRFLADAVCNVDVEDVQVDELWSFVGCKEKTREARSYGHVRCDCTKHEACPYPFSR